MKIGSWLVMDNELIIFLLGITSLLALLILGATVYNVVAVVWGVPCG